MSEGRARRSLWPAVGLLVVVTVLLVAYAVFRGDLIRHSLDPRTPFQTYRPPPAPDYAKPAAWYVLPPHPEAPTSAEPSADVFFVGPTTFDGGRDWNGPVGDARAEKLFRQVMAPNYAGPFVRLGRIFAPRYRQASLYSQMNLSEDARQARAFAYGDVLAAFRAWRTRYGDSRPFVVVGVEQGGTVAARLLSDEIGPDPALSGRLAAAYLIETVVPAGQPPLTPCRARAEAQPIRIARSASWTALLSGGPAASSTTSVARPCASTRSWARRQTRSRRSGCIWAAPTPRVSTGRIGRRSWPARSRRDARAVSCGCPTRGQAR